MPNKDGYVLPAAHYEAAVISWMESYEPSCYPSTDLLVAESYRRLKTRECLGHLERVSRWDRFHLDGRIRARAQSGIEMASWLKARKKWI